jgi:hypothetical protein
MNRETEASGFTRMRRSDKAADDRWIRALLHRAPTAALATVSAGQPFINMNLFVYDEAAHAIYMHTAGEGRTRTNVEGEARISFAVWEMGRLLPADTALEFSVEYAGVVVFGRASIIQDEKEAQRALQMLLDKYAPQLRPGRDYRPITAEEIARTSVYRIAIEAWSGKDNFKPADYPGAFFYHQPSTGT